MTAVDTDAVWRSGRGHQLGAGWPARTCPPVSETSNISVANRRPPSAPKTAPGCGCAGHMQVGDQVDLSFPVDKVVLLPANRRELMRAAPATTKRIRRPGVVLPLPSLLYIICMFVYPFLYGFISACSRKNRSFSASYIAFFSDPISTASGSPSTLPSRPLSSFWCWRCVLPMACAAAFSWSGPSRPS